MIFSFCTLYLLITIVSIVVFISMESDANAFLRTQHLAPKWKKFLPYEIVYFVMGCIMPAFHIIITINTLITYDHSVFNLATEKEANLISFVIDKER